MDQKDDIKKRESYLISISEKIYNYVFEWHFRRLSKPEQVFFCIWELESQVNNGGLNQYFFNSGEYTSETITALEEIGAFYTADLLRKAVALFPGGKVPKEWRACQEIVTAMDDATDKKLDELDVLFYEYKDNLSELLYDFTQKNRSMIRGA
jgi:hypothetical protein